MKLKCEECGKSLTGEDAFGHDCEVGVEHPCPCCFESDEEYVAEVLR